jgi:hypothetical protein
MIVLLVLFFAFVFAAGLALAAIAGVLVLFWLAVHGAARLLGYQITDRAIMRLSVILALVIVLGTLSATVGASRWELIGAAIGALIALKTPTAG